MSSGDLPTPPRMRSRRPPRRTLNPDAIVEAAMAVLDEGGVDSLNMRAVADRLGTGPSSLYAHFAGKDELLAAMIDRLAADLPTPEVGAGAWQEQLKEAIRGIRSGLAAHRDLARAALGTIPTGPNALRWINGLLGVLRDAGLPDHVISYAVDVLPLYATATAYEESLYTPKDNPETAEQYIADLRRYWQALPVDRFPHIVALAVPLTSEVEPDARFEFGLDALVRGIETMKGPASA
ncbi:TetR/AcrR family transcriptional regulator [Solirubrobacter ginsenosidimutans]|nr:TetR/AcrR family transcriptional regulator [Solirubrobacter ginsenosidimutans]